MVRTLGIPRRLAVALVLVVVFAVGVQPHAYALDAGGAGSQLVKIAPLLYPASVAIPAGMGAGTAGVAGGLGAAAALPLLGAVGAGVLLGGAMYVGYRQLSGDPVEWWWQDGQTDPALVAAAEQTTWSMEHAGVPVIGYFETSPTGNIDFWFELTEDYDDPIHPDATCSTCHLQAQFLDTSINSAWRTLGFETGDVAGTRHHFSTPDYMATWDFSFRVREGESTTWRDLGETVAVEQGGELAFGGDPDAEAVVRTRIECTDTGTGATRWIEAVSDPYGPDGDPAPMPDLACAEGERITDVELWREAPGVDPLRISEPIQFPPVIPAPSTVPVEQHDLWDDCFTGACVVEVHRLDEEGERVRKLAPPGDMGWHLDTERTLKYGCFWAHPDGEYMPLDLTDCWSLQWVPDPITGEPMMPVPDGPGGDPQLDTPVGTGSAQGCDGTTEAGFLGSKIITRAIKCALVDLFVPSEATLQQLELKADLAKTKAPFSIFVGIGQWGGTIGELPDECWTIAPEVLDYGTYSVADTCGSNPVTDHMASLRGIMTVAVYGAFVMPIAWWAWRQYAPGSQGMA